VTGMKVKTNVKGGGVLLSDWPYLRANPPRRRWAPWRSRPTSRAAASSPAT